MNRIAIFPPCVIGLLLGAFYSGCSAAGDHGVAKIESIVAKLRSSNEEVRMQGRLALAREYGTRDFTREEGRFVLEAAAKPFPPGIAEWDDTGHSLVLRVPRLPEFIPLIERYFDSYTPQTRDAALMLLCNVQTVDSAAAHMRLLHAYRAPGQLHRLGLTAAIEGNAALLGVYFPAILEFAKDPRFELEVYSNVWQWLEKGNLSREQIAPYADQVLASLSTHRERLAALQRETGSAWMWSDGYDHEYWQADMALRVSGFLPLQAAGPGLRDALTLKDPRLRALAAASLLRLGASVDPNVLEQIAAFPIARNRLYDELARIGKLDHFPEKHRNQAALAESRLADWLSSPSQLARAPDEMESLGVVTVDSDEGPAYDYYVYRFRVVDPKSDAPQGWLSGVAVFEHGASLSTGGDGAFSDLESAEGKTAQDIVDSLEED